MTTEKELEELEQLHIICKDMEEKTYLDLVKYIEIVKKYARKEIIEEIEKMIKNDKNYGNFYLGSEMLEYMKKQLKKFKGEKQ